MIEVTWKIAQLERNTSDDGVVVAHWRCNGVDGEYTAANYGTVSFQPDPTDAGFVPFDQLTEAQVIGWVKDSMQSTREIPAVVDEDGNETTPASTETVDGAANIEASVQAKIEEQKAPATTTGMPWAA